MTSTKEQFYKWLDTTARTGEVPSIKKSCSIVDDYCKNNKKLGFSLFDPPVDEDIFRVKAAIDKDVFFRAKHGRYLHKITLAVQMYLKFMTTAYLKSKEICDKDKDSDSNADLDLVDKKSFFAYLIQESRVANNTGRCYCSYVTGCETFGRENQIGTGALYTASTKQEAIDNTELLLGSDKFLEYSRNSHNTPIVALRKYHEFLTGIKDAKKPNEATEFIGVDFEKYRKVLLDNYQKGFRLNDKLSLKRFRMQWKQSFSEDLDFADEIVFQHINHITIQHGGMAYLPDAMVDSNTKAKLLSYIDHCFADGVNAVYYEALYKEFSSAFVNCRINNVEMLKTYLTYVNNGKYFLHRSYLSTKKDVEVDPTDEVRDLLISQNIPMRTENIVEELSHIPEDKIKWAIAGSHSAEFVRNQKGEYFHADIIEFTQSELDSIISWIGDAINEKEYISGSELVELIEKNLPEINERYPFLTWLGLRDVIAYKLKDEFSFKGKIISALGTELTMSDVFAEFAKKHEHFTLSQLNALKNDLDTPIYFDPVYANSLRINKEEFVSQRQAAFDITATDAAIDRFCSGEFISISEVSHFGSFPFAYFTWNHFLLQHYVANYSKKYKLIHTGFNAGMPVGAIVKRSSPLDSFEEVIIRALAESNISLNENDALQFLCDAGFLARRNYGNIDYVVNQANMQRTLKGD